MHSILLGCSDLTFKRLTGLANRCAMVLTCLAFSHTGFAEDGWLIAAESESVNIGQTIRLETVKPQSLASWPVSLQLQLTGADITEELVLTAGKLDPANPLRLAYTGTVSKKFVGILHAELVGLSSNRLLLLASSDEAGAAPIVAMDAKTPSSQQAASGAADVTPAPAKDAPPTIVIAKPGDEPGLSVNEPSYFILGSGDEQGTDARFQISFKYRAFDPEGAVAERFPFLSNFYFAYTQTSLWDIGGDSSPFRDTSYRPSAFYRWVGAGRGIVPDEWRVGLEHESNGQAGLDSRSLNIAYIRPTWNIDLANGKRLLLLPKFYDYIEKSDNPDLQRYRGYVDWQLRYGREDGLIASALYRLGTAGYSTEQIDVSYPLSERIFARTGTFIHLQLFRGYGETLLDYNKENDAQIRLGISLSR